LERGFFILLTLTNINFTGENLHVTILERTVAIENCTIFVTGGKIIFCAEKLHIKVKVHVLSGDNY